jgi:hypothetical protein
MNTKSLYSALAFAGVTPFLACALLPLLGIDALPRIGRLDEVANSYGLAIVCFLSGIHWAQHLDSKVQVPLNLMVTSNAVFLFAWFAFLLGATKWSLAMQIVALVAILAVDWRLTRAGVIEADYFRVRSIATALASAALATIILS